MKRPIVWHRHESRAFNIGGGFFVEGGQLHVWVEDDHYNGTVPAADLPELLQLVREALGVLVREPYDPPAIEHSAPFGGAELSRLDARACPAPAAMEQVELRPHPLFAIVAAARDALKAGAADRGVQTAAPAPAPAAGAQERQAVKPARRPSTPPRARAARRRARRPW